MINRNVRDEYGIGIKLKQISPKPRCSNILVRHHFATVCLISCNSFQLPLFDDSVFRCITITTIVSKRVYPKFFITNDRIQITSNFYRTRITGRFREQVSCVTVIMENTSQQKMRMDKAALYSKLYFLF